MTQDGQGQVPKPPATLSVDLDNLWCYQRSFGLEGWRQYPSFLEVALPRLLDLLDRLELRLTLFVIARDAERAGVRVLLAEAVARGHEVANHSYDHETELHLWPRARVREELVRAGEAIEAACGQRPRGFRGPAYGTSADLLGVLAELGYAYDASSYPNTLGMLARHYHRRQMARLGGKAALSEGMYGNFADAMKPLAPYLWSLPEGTLVEVPVTTLPLLRLPFHGTYLNQLASHAPGLARAYFGSALWLCRRREVPPSFLLHAADLLGHDDCPSLDYLPGMRCSGDEKRAFMAEVLARYKREFDVQPIGAFVEGITKAGGLREQPVGEGT